MGVEVRRGQGEGRRYQGNEREWRQRRSLVWWGCRFLMGHLFLCGRCQSFVAVLFSHLIV